MKKLFIYILSASLIWSSNSKAILAGSASGGTAILGYVVGGALTFSGGSLMLDDNRNDYFGLTFLIGTLPFLLGIFILDENGSQEVQFAALSESDALKLGLSSNELALYNTQSQLDRLNAVSSEISSEVKAFVAANQNLDKKEVLKASKDLWQKKVDQGDISKDMLSVVQKMLQAQVK